MKIDALTKRLRAEALRKWAKYCKGYQPTRYVPQFDLLMKRRKGKPC